jgi:CubicO group peptidase (beta-lactamase class C family)
MPVVGRPLTLLDLVTHAAGLPRLPPGWWWRAARHSDNPYAVFTESDLWQAVGRTTGRRRPGAFRYSNDVAGLLGHRLARAAGTDYAELVASRICEPLGLRDTGVSSTPRQRDQQRVAPGHTARGRPVPGWDLPVLTGAGALRSTADDLVTFLRAQWLLDAGTPLGRAVAATHAQRVRTGRGPGVALGWMTAPDTLWHNGGTGGYRSFVAVRPAERRAVAVAVLTNTAQSVDGIGIRLMGPGARPPTHHPSRS